MLDTTYARLASNGDVRIYADELNAIAWRNLQETYQVGQLLMPCCPAPAIPKTSPLGLQFFAHASGQCGSSPEGIWHQQAKETVAQAARALGYRAVIEHPSPDGWRADVWIDAPGRPVAIELQHSYLHLRDYLRRQERYKVSGVACLWLVMVGPCRTLNLATYRVRAKEIGGRLPEAEGASLKTLPAALLSLDGTPMVHGRDLHSPVGDVLAAFCSDRLIWLQGRWLIDGKPQSPPWAPV